MPGKYRDFDVAVIGGGPAGAAAAIECCRRGLSTVIVDSAPSPLPRPGETLHPGVEALFRSLGVDGPVNQAGFIRHPGYFIRSDGESSFYRYGADARGEWLGYQAERNELARLLQSRAVEVGAVVRPGERAVRPILNGGRVNHLLTTSGSYSVAFLVDAAGGAHWLRQHCALSLVRVSGRLLARYGWIESGADLLQNGSLPEFRTAGSQWYWIAPVCADRYAWVSVQTDPSGRAAPDLPPPIAHLGAAGPARTSDVTWRIVRPCCGPGYFLTGDAAYVLDPACSHGVLKAIMSGMMAAHAISQILEGKAETEILSAYNRWMEAWFCTDANALLEVYSRLEPPPSWLSKASEELRKISIQPFS